MIVLATNKSIMKSKLEIMLFEFRSHDCSCDSQIDHEIKTQNKALLGNFDLMKKGWSGDQIIIRNFNLMINLSTSWKSWISISWNLTSWPWVNYYRSCLKSIYLKIKLLFEATTLANENLTMVKDTKCNSNIRHIFPSFSWKVFRIF